MPWTQTDPMHERLHFVLAHAQELFSMTELCARFGISRKSGYKWLERYRSEGLPGLVERSRAPQHCPHRLSAEVEAVLLEAKRAHPNWGPRKILAFLARRRPELPLPAASTAGECFRRAGLVQSRSPRRRVQRPDRVPLEVHGANQVWSADFKGEFRTRDRQLCYPLTVSDAYSRYLLGCEALGSVRTAEAQPVFQRLFERFGLPERIRTDNGPPFASSAVGGLCQLSVWWIKLGIRPERIEPGRPEQNGRHERMHRTLKAETTRPPEADRVQQQARFEDFRREYNQERPHEALAQQCPADLYQSSARAMPTQLPKAEYPGHWEVRRIGHGGTFRFQGQQRFLSETLYRESIGLEESEDGVWSIYFYDVLLARFHERDQRITR